MSEEKIENPNLPNEGEGEPEIESENQPEGSEGADETVETLKEKNQSLYEQLKKAKGFTRDEEGKWIKKPEPKIEPKPKAKSDEFGYDKKAFLSANGIKGTKEFDFVRDEVKKSGEELENLLENEYFQTKLEKFRALNKTAEATPKGSGRSSVATDSVEYWMTKPIEDVPQEMRIKVVNARLKQDESKGKFYNQK